MNKKTIATIQRWEQANSRNIIFEVCFQRIWNDRPPSLFLRQT